MKPVPSSRSDTVDQRTKFEQFLIINRFQLMLASFVGAVVLTFVILGPSGPMRQTPHNFRLQTARQIGQCLFTYAVDHDGKYPVGKSSTDIFQQLIDQDYVFDPEIFYFYMPGKIKPTTNKLKPENVCFDVTNGVLQDDPDSLPMVISTGFKIDYVPGGKAHLLANGDPKGIAVFYKGNEGLFLKGEPDGIPLFPPNFAGSSGPNPVSAFDPKGRVYQQLTPDGPLP